MKKKMKITYAPGFMSDLDQIPDEEREEIEKDLKEELDKMASGEIVGEPVDMEELRKEEPEVFQMIIERLGSSNSQEGEKK